MASRSQYYQAPAEGSAIRLQAGKLQVPENPIIPFIEGDGTGPDIWRATVQIIDAAVEHAYGGQRRIFWYETFAGEKAFRLLGAWLPGETLAAFQQYVVGLKGPLTTPVGGGFRSLNVSIRQELDLYACVRPVRWFPGVPSPVARPQDVDIVVFRENTEDVYRGIEWRHDSPEAARLRRFLGNEMGVPLRDDTGLGIKPISAFGSQRLVRMAINYAQQRGRRSVTLVHKGNIQKFTEGAFRDWGYEVAEREFPATTLTEDELWKRHEGRQPADRIVIKDRIADVMFQHLLLRPREFDILATTNLNGDYLSDAVAAQVGGIGIAPGANIGDEVAIFEATHGTAPKYAGLDKVNPSSLLLSGVMMLEHIGWQEAADAIVAALERTIQDKVVTYDFARQMEGAREVKTSEFAQELVHRL